MKASKKRLIFQLNNQASLNLAFLRIRELLSRVQTIQCLLFFRQFKDHHLRHSNSEQAHQQNGGYQQPRLTASALARMQQLQGESSLLPTTTTRSLYDVKAMQKEAVLSYVKVD